MRNYTVIMLILTYMWFNKTWEDQQIQDFALLCWKTVISTTMYSKNDNDRLYKIYQKVKLSIHTMQWPSTNTTWGRYGKPVTLEATYALYQSVIVWKRFAYSKRVTKSVGSSTHWSELLPSQKLKYRTKGHDGTITEKCTWHQKKKKISFRGH